ncbi:hypothetical protein BDV33DRAFT_57739 [Aspergillus novoparasiticus]|uniref:Uncharacterized protein n=1 Tax=Aspergillus novoparasiticus TaxID=986946 RepID=A0A5N6E9U8_9EURO|nr:hypothetical protein BDV33DRAFT_57739 [Aspergillus novoparasiticus]
MLRAHRQPPSHPPPPPPPENNDQHTRPSKEQPEIPPVSSEDSGVTNTMSTVLEPNASGPPSRPSSLPPENDEQHTLPNKEQPEIPPVSPEESSGIYHKRRYTSSSEPQPALPARNLRPRVDKSGFQEITRPSAQYEDHWKGRFSHHPVLATVPNDQRTEIERRSNGALRSDLPDFIDEHSKSWNSNGFWPSLLSCPSKLPNMPALPKGRQIWRYVQAIDAEGEVHYLKARLAYVKLYLEYVEEFDRQKQKCRADQTAERQAITKICGTRPKDRKLFNEHKLRGARWWWSGCVLGLGFILICSKYTGSKMSLFPWLHCLRSFR